MALLLCDNPAEFEPRLPIELRIGREFIKAHVIMRRILLVTKILSIALKHASSTLEMIDDGMDGIQVDLSDAEPAASLMLYLADHPHEAQCMGAAARDNFMSLATVPGQSLAFLFVAQRKTEPQPA